MRLFVSSLLLTVVLLPQAAFAETVLRTGSDISVGSEQVVEGDYYASAGVFSGVVMSGVVEEDMYGFGAVVTVNGEVGSDATLAGGTVQVHGPVGDDLRIFAGEVVVAEPVTGDLFVLGGTVSVLSSATIEGDVFIFGGNATIEGPVTGSVYVQAEQLTLNAAVGENVTVTAPAGFMLGDQASVVGDVHYESMVPIGRAPGAVVEGELVKGQAVAQSPQEQARSLLVPLFISLFTILSLYLLFKQQLQAVVQTAQNESGRSMLVGTGVLVAGPFVAFVLMATVLGAVVGIGLFAFLIVLYVASFALTGAVLGVLVMRLFKPQAELSLVTIIAGTILLHGLFFIPILGILTFVVLLCITLGSVVLGLYRSVQ